MSPCLDSNLWPLNPKLTRVGVTCAMLTWLLFSSLAYWHRWFHRLGFGCGWALYFYTKPHEVMVYNPLCISVNPIWCHLDTRDSYISSHKWYNALFCVYAMFVFLCEADTSFRRSPGSGFCSSIIERDCMQYMLILTLFLRQCFAVLPRLAWVTLHPPECRDYSCAPLCLTKTGTQYFSTS